MAYKILDKKEVNYQKSGLELVKYAILDNDGKLFLQVKIKNIDTVKIESFTIVFRAYEETIKYDIDYVSAPGEEFYDKTLIPIEDEDFEFITFKNVVKEKVVSSHEKSEYVEKYDDDEYEYVRRKKKKLNPVKPDKFSIVLLIISLILFILGIFIYIW